MKKIKILIVDDNLTFLEVLNEFLIANDYDVLKCNNGKEAQDRFTEYCPDIVLTDIVMPEFDGIELLLGLRKINPDIKVVVMSGGNNGHADSYLQMADKLGANVILNKPFELSALLKQMRQLEIVA